MNTVKLYRKIRDLQTYCLINPEQRSQIKAKFEEIYHYMEFEK